MRWGGQELNLYYSNNTWFWFLRGVLPSCTHRPLQQSMLSRRGSPGPGRKGGCHEGCQLAFTASFTARSTVSSSPKMSRGLIRLHATRNSFRAAAHRAAPVVPGRKPAANGLYSVCGGTHEAVLITSAVVHTDSASQLLCTGNGARCGRALVLRWEVWVTFSACWCPCTLRAGMF